MIGREEVESPRESLHVVESYFREGHITNRKVFQLYFLYTRVVSNSNKKSDLGILQNR